MAGLNLIQEYLSDTDEETDKLNNENQDVFNNKNKNTKLPLPQSIISWKGVSHHEEVVDDPSKHDGRIRSFKHERGNWSTLVYIEYIPVDDMIQWMKNICIQTTKIGNIFEDFHVSLTRTLIIKFHWIDSFTEAVKRIVNNYPSFMMELGNIKIYCNEEKTRTFMGITIQSTNNFLEGLIHALNELLEEYELPTFYKDASFHISFMWFLGDQQKALETLLPSLTSSLYDFLNEHPEERYVQINQVKCKIGNKLYNFNLR